MSANALMKTVLMSAVCMNLAACGGSTPELGPATAPPPVDKAKMEENMKKSFEMNKMKGEPPKAQ